jgi:hypothetical protein
MMPQIVNHWPIATEAWVQFQVSLCAICDGQGGTGAGFLDTVQQYCTVIHPSLTLYKLNSLQLY